MPADNNLTIVIIDYSAGNLRSVSNAIKQLGYCPHISSDPEDMDNADAVIMPGVGAASDTMANLEKFGFIEPVRRYIAAERPFFGVCMGLQVMLEGTEEGGGQSCMGVIPGKVRRLPDSLKVPHMGWNQVKQRIAHPIFRDIPDDTNFYFVHSYYAEPKEKSLIAGITEYSIPFCSIVARNKLVATQFHPEKSGEMGLRMYRNFLQMAQVK